jgi:hypothetical protein
VRHLASQDGELMPEHKNLGILGSAAHSPQSDHFDDATDQRVEKAESHTAGSSLQSPLVKQTIGRTRRGDPVWLRRSRPEDENARNYARSRRLGRCLAREALKGLSPNRITHSQVRR